MKILHVNKFFDLRGGAEFYVHELMAHQKKQGHEVHVFATRSEKETGSEDEKYFVKRHAYDRIEGPIKDLQKAADFIWNARAAKSLSRMLSDIKPDVIHLHNIYHHLSTSLLAEIRRSKIPCVQTLHDYKLACPNYKMFTEGKICERCKGGRYSQAIRHDCLNGILFDMLAVGEMEMTKFRQSYEKTVRTFICPSEFMKNKMAEWGEPPSKLKHIANPVDIPEKVSSERGTGSYVYLGRLSQEKGVEVIIRAFARVPSAELLVVGQGPEQLSLQRLAEEHSASNIKFLGFQTGEALISYRSKARALVMPTLMYENSSLSILEALADGVPVIGSDIGGIPELVKDGVNGFLVQSGKVDAWIEALEQMDSFDLKQRIEMGDAGREIAIKNHNWEKHLKELERVYR